MKKMKMFESNLIGLQSNMLHYALLLTTNKETAKDLRQETNLKTLDNRSKFKDDLNFKGWVFTIMHNLFVNNYRKMVRQKCLFDYTSDLYFLNTSWSSKPDTPEAIYNYAEMVGIINTFDGKLKKPLWMHISGYKYKEIAAIMKLPIGTVKSRIFFIRKKIQQVYD